MSNKAAEQEARAKEKVIIAKGAYNPSKWLNDILEAESRAKAYEWQTAAIERLLAGSGSFDALRFNKIPGVEMTGYRGMESDFDEFEDDLDAPFGTIIFSISDEEDIEITRQVLLLC